MSNISRFASDTLLSFGEAKARRNTQHKDDGSEVTDTDLTIEAKFREAFPDLPVVGEEGKPINDGKQTFRIIDPVDGTALHARGQDRWNIAISRYEDGVPVVSVAAGWGIRASYRKLYADGQIDFENHYGSLQSQQGYVLEANATGTWLKPLYTRRESFVTQLAPVTPIPLTDKSTLLMVPCLTLPSSYFNAGIRVVTAESTVGAQVEVILGMADACLLGPAYSLSENPDQPTPSLWDLIPRAVHNAGLVYVIATGPEAGEILPIVDLIGFCDEKYKLTEQLLVCPISHIAGLTARITKLRALLK